MPTLEQTKAELAALKREVAAEKSKIQPQDPQPTAGNAEDEDEVEEDPQMDMLVFAAYLLLFAVSIVSNYVAIPVHVQLLLSATLPIYIASHNSLTLKAQETMKSGDAWKAPVAGSVALFSLYLVYTLLPPYWPNLLLRAYFMIAGIVALQLTLRRFVDPMFKKLGVAGSTKKFDWNEKWVLGEIKLRFNNSDILATVVALAASAWYVTTKHWWGNNMFGLAFCIQAIENVSLGKYATGAILLSGLFVYDVFWVFGTDVMVTVAMSFDAPIKLLFPRHTTEVDTSVQFSMLGLGDIVIPGIFVALLLRFDKSQAQAAVVGDSAATALLEAGADFAKPVFNVTIISYVLGLVTTVLVMYHFNAAQPALLYLVPFTLLASFGTAAVTGQVTAILAYSEEDEGDDEDDEKEKHKGKDTEKEKAD